MFAKAILNTTKSFSCSEMIKKIINFFYTSDMLETVIKVTSIIAKLTVENLYFQTKFGTFHRTMDNFSTVEVTKIQTYGGMIIISVGKRLFQPLVYFLAS